MLCTNLITSTNDRTVQNVPNILDTVRMAATLYVIYCGLPSGLARGHEGWKAARIEFFREKR